MQELDSLLHRFLTILQLHQCNASANCKPLKTLGFEHLGVAISSRIHEVRENLCWILEGRALPLKGLEAILVDLHRSDLRAKIREARWRTAIFLTYRGAVGERQRTVSTGHGAVRITS